MTKVNKLVTNWPLKKKINLEGFICLAKFFEISRKHNGPKKETETYDKAFTNMAKS